MPAKITGIVESQVILRIGKKKMILYCSDDLVTQLEDHIPCQGIAEYVDGTLLSFDSNSTWRSIPNTNGLFLCFSFQAFFFVFLAHKFSAVINMYIIEEDIEQNYINVHIL